jgi:hypothetical protein
LFKKIAAISLLSVLLFNWVGYRLFTAYCEKRAAFRLEASLDKDQYDPGQLILIRVPADALPYSNFSAEFRKTTGTLDIGTAHYRKISKRLYNDSIEFLCIPDGDANRYQSARNEFFKLVNDLAKTKTPGPSGKTGIHKIVWYQQHHFPYLPDVAIRTAPYFPSPRTALAAGHHSISLLPPRPAQPLS